jgi:hypothetical protein
LRRLLGDRLTRLLSSCGGRALELDELGLELVPPLACLHSAQVDFEPQLVGDAAEVIPRIVFGCLGHARSVALLGVCATPRDALAAIATYGLQVSSDERLRAAQAALVERTWLVQRKAELVANLAGAEQRLKRQAEELRRAQANVQRHSTGVLGLIENLLGDSRLTPEQRDAAEAHAQLRVVTEVRDALRVQLAMTDERLASLFPEAIALELQAARSAKETELRLGGGAAADGLLDLAVRLESLDIELVPLQEALAAGHAALAKLAEVIALLDTARDDRETRKRADPLVADAEARMLELRRAVTNLASGGADRIAAAHPEAAFAERWMRALFGRGDHAARLAAAHANIDERFAYVRDLLLPVRVRHDELAGRRAALVDERDLLLLG